MKRITNEDSGPDRRDFESYRITADEIRHYREQGYLTLDGFLTETEMETLDPWFDHFIQGKQPDMGKDFCDMSQPYGKQLVFIIFTFILIILILSIEAKFYERFASIIYLPVVQIIYVVDRWL